MHLEIQRPRLGIQRPSMGNQRPHLGIPRPRHAVQRPHPVIRRPPFGWLSAQPAPAAPAAAPRLLPGRAPGWPGGGGARGAKGTKSAKRCKKFNLFQQLTNTITQLQPQARSWVESGGNAKMSTFWGFPAFDPPRTLIFFDQVHHFCTGVRKVTKYQLFAVFTNFMVLSPPGGVFLR